MYSSGVGILGVTYPVPSWDWGRGVGERNTRGCLEEETQNKSIKHCQYYTFIWFSKDIKPKMYFKPLLIKY